MFNMDGVFIIVDFDSVFGMELDGVFGMDFNGVFGFDLVDETNMMIHPRIDLSFKDLICAKDAVNAAPREGQRRLSKNSEMKFVSRSVCLSNNRITDLTGLQCILSHFLAEPWMLGWLDLSFNQLPCIDPVLCELQELRVLYLHGNNIQKLSEVDKLAELPFLHTITLHGNAIVSCTGYRGHVISTLRRLKHMDFSAVTPAELSLANLWHRSSKHGSQKKSNERGRRRLSPPPPLKPTLPPPPPPKVGSVSKRVDELRGCYSLDLVFGLCLTAAPRRQQCVEK
ncbi:uncharacterized protein V6R79_011195 [Siganus canaliculatus]